VAAADDLLAWRSLTGGPEALGAYQALVHGQVPASEALVVEVEER